MRIEESGGENLHETGHMKQVDKINLWMGKKKKSKFVASISFTAVIQSSAEQRNKLISDMRRFNEDLLLNANDCIR